MKSQVVNKLDKVGATTSSLCAIHCLLMPLVITMLPLLGLSFLASEPVELGLLGSSAVIGTLSLCMGYKIHGSKIALSVLATGIAILAMSHISHHADTGLGWLPFLGGILVASAHFVNHKLCKSCKACHDGCSSV